MVKKISLVLLLVSLQACSPAKWAKKWWGEAAPDPSVVQMPQSTSNCPEVSVIFEGEDADSSVAFECFAKKTTEIWDQVVGRKKDAISERELELLIEKKLIAPKEDSEESRKFVFGLKGLLGIRGDLTRDGVDGWVRFLRENRSVIRMIYQKILIDREGITYANLQEGGYFLSAFLRRVRWKVDSYEFAEKFNDIFSVKDPQIRNAMVPASSVAINLLNAVCDNFAAPDFWNSDELAICISDVVDNFQPGAAWVEFALNPVENYREDQLKEINQAIEVLAVKVTAWFENSRLSMIRTDRLVELSRRLGAPPPPDIIEKLNIIRRFNSRSDGSYIHPSAIPGLFKSLWAYHKMLLPGLPLFVNTLQERKCLNQEALEKRAEEQAQEREVRAQKRGRGFGHHKPKPSWRDCEIAPSDEVRRSSENIDIALRIQNPHYGQKVTPFSGNRFAKTMLYHTLSGGIVDAFELKDEGKKGAVGIDLRDENNELLQVLSLGLSSYETIRSFIKNIIRKFHGEAFEDEHRIKDLQRQFDLKRMTKLIALTNDVLVIRTPEERSQLEKWISNVTNFFPESATYLDRLGITAVIVLLDSLSDYHDAYARIIGVKNLQVSSQEDDKKWYLERSRFRELLPELLKETFPRTYEGCMKRGFNQSCFVAFNGIIPQSNIVGQESEYLNIQDLDLMTIVAAAMEGLFDSCDYNKDGRLSRSFGDGNDELDCAYFRSKDALIRLLDAKIVKTPAAQAELIRFVANFLNFGSITRTGGKTLLVEGTRDWWLFHWIKYLFAWGEKSELGKFYSLLAESVDSDAVQRERDAQKVDANTRR